MKTGDFWVNDYFTEYSQLATRALLLLPELPKIMTFCRSQLPANSHAVHTAPLVPALRYWRARCTLSVLDFISKCGVSRPSPITNEPIKIYNCKTFLTKHRIKNAEEEVQNISIALCGRKETQREDGSQRINQRATSLILSYFWM